MRQESIYQSEREWHERGGRILKPLKGACASEEVVSLMNAGPRTGCLRQRGRGGHLVILLLLATLSASAHAILKESLPAPHSVVSGPDIEIRLRFNSRIDAGHSRVYLDGGSHPQQIEISRQAAPDTLLGHAKNVTAGEYRIQWQILAVDGHITRGEVPFTVR